MQTGHAWCPTTPRYINIMQSMNIVRIDQIKSQVEPYMTFNISSIHIVYDKASVNITARILEGKQSGLRLNISRFREHKYLICPRNIVSFRFLNGKITFKKVDLFLWETLKSL